MAIVVTFGSELKSALRNKPCNVIICIFLFIVNFFFYNVHFLPKDRLVPEIGKAVFGEDRERSFKDVVACFEQLGQERLAKILVVFFP